MASVSCNPSALEQQERQRIVRIDAVLDQQSATAVCMAANLYARAITTQHEIDPSAAQHADAVEDDDAIGHARSASPCSARADRCRRCRHAHRSNSVRPRSSRTRRNRRTAQSAAAGTGTAHPRVCHTMRSGSAVRPKISTIGPKRSSRPSRPGRMTDCIRCSPKRRVQVSRGSEVSLPSLRSMTTWTATSS